VLEALSGLVTRVGELLLRWRAQGRTSGHWSGTQFKAEADVLADSELRDGLRRIDTAIPVISEEDAVHAGTRPVRYWLIDPLDGTASFAGGFDGFVTQAALIEGAVPRLAAVYAPVLRRTYCAELGGGAFVGGKRLRIRLGPPKTLTDNTPAPQGLAGNVYEALGLTRYLESGSIGLKICRVADSSADLFVKDVAVRDWDLAAPQLILEEAGGVLTDLAGRRIPYSGSYRREGLVAASNRALLERVVDLAARVSQSPQPADTLLRKD
jgi:3'(2'), 5'-bisphosphate nucleotidase/myo-inositol-1(or 4)-monophosphatase